MNSLTYLKTLFDGGEIQRYHTKRLLGQQTVGAHSARVGMLCMVVRPDCSANVLRAALVHDVSELATGDVPSPVKWANPLLKQELSRVTGEFEAAHGLRVELTEDEKLLLRWADLAEGAMFCIDQLELGNQNMIGTLTRYATAMCKTDQFAADQEEKNRRDLIQYYVNEQLDKLDRWNQR